MWIMGAGFLLFPLVGILERQWIYKNKIEADAVVVTTLMASTEEGYTYRPVFRYTVAGTVYETQYTTGDIKPKYPNGTVVRIYCHKDKPNRILVPKDKTRTIIMLIFSIIGLAFLGIAMYNTITGA